MSRIFFVCYLYQMLFKYLRKSLLLVIASLIMISFSYGQRTTITLGPVLTLGKNSLQKNGRKGIGVGAEMYRQFFKQGGVRLYVGNEKFHTSGRENDQVRYTTLRAGYQHFLKEDKFTFWGDAGAALFNYAFYGSYSGLSLSAGGGYNLWMKKNGLIQFQCFYSYATNVDPDNDAAVGGWITLRAAFGIRVEKKKVRK